MPELPDIQVYILALAARVTGARLENVRLRGPFLLRTVDPPLDAVLGRHVLGLRRIGKRIAFEMQGGYFLVLHLMIAGRLRWESPGARLPGRIGLAAFDFTTGTLLLTEAGTKKRASLHLVSGEGALSALDRGGLDVLESDLAAFGRAITRENHTLKRALTDPRVISGIGNAYSDEILHRARLSPFHLTGRLQPEELRRLHQAAREVLRKWVERIRQETGDGFPTGVTAFRPGMAVHGRFREPCPVCGAPVQRIVYSQNECNYCPGCQTQGRILADRALSRLLRKDWQKHLDDLEERRPS